MITWHFSSHNHSQTLIYIHTSRLLLSSDLQPIIFKAAYVIEQTFENFLIKILLCYIESKRQSNSNDLVQILYRF